MKPVPDLAPIEELDSNIHALCTRINAATYELPVLVREFDERAGFLKWGLHNCAEWLAWRCRELRCGSVESIDSAARASANRSLRIRRDHNRHSMTITVELPMDTGELLERALDKARDDEVLQVPDLAETAWATRQADAFVNVVSGYLAGGDAATNDNSLVTVHVDQSALTGGDGRSALPIESVKRLCCDGQALVITEDNNTATTLSTGRAVERQVSIT